ncbi:cyclophilin-like domain-containing protein [Chytriomyces sp. MP71]|nr:cyclophilin-like domain-containing protein [Chytriomyces sp. MP71]
MSSAYATEPPTKGKVVLKTTLGELEVELWPKEAPKAVRNFVQLCLEGFYDDTIFHRVVKDFIVQGGDPSGTGLGGESIYDEPFADEFHSRLRFSHRGLLAMANTQRNCNGSQFFFTLDKTPELDRKNTIFGKIVGDTIFNLLEIGGVEVDDDERPSYPVKITSVEVLSNPFDDIEPRTTAHERRAERDAQERILAAAKEAETKKTKGKKNLSLLSFGDDEDASAGTDTALPAEKRKIKSSHDLLAHDSRLRRDTLPPLSSIVAQTAPRETNPAATSNPTLSPAVIPSKRSRDKDSDISDDSDGDSDSDAPVPATAKRIDSATARRADIAKVQAQLIGLESAKRAKSAPAPALSAAQTNPLAALREAYRGKAILGRRRGKGAAEEGDVLKSLAAFKEKVSAPTVVAGESAGQKKVSGVCVLHGLEGCLSCRREDRDDREEDDNGSVAPFEAILRKFCIFMTATFTGG